MTTEQAESVKQLLEDSHSIVIVQADNPDGDSVGSALALEHILHTIGKKPHLYCAVDVPNYLRYMSGWDRIDHTLPNQFDAAIIVDTATKSLLEKGVESGDFKRIIKKPTIVLDHHTTVEDIIPNTHTTIIDANVSSTGELIFKLAQMISLPLDTTSGEHIMTAILGDTQGLSNDLAKASTYRVMSQLVELGVDRPALEDKRRLSSKMPEVIYKYKGVLLARTQFLAEGALALVSIPQQEINDYSPLYNPGPLIQPDMLQVEKVMMAIVLKQYDDGKITAALRANRGAPIAGEIAAHFGGGGHDFAAGFKTSDHHSITALISLIEQEYINRFATLQTTG